VVKKIRQKAKQIVKPAFRWQGLFFYLSLGMLFLLLAVLFTWPLMTNISSGIIGQSNFTDGPFFVWNIWWIKKALLSFQNPFYSNFVYYPANTNLSLHTLTFTTGLIYLPFSLFFSEVVSLNLIQIASIIISALAMTYLVNYLSKAKNYLEKSTGIISGIIFAFSPFVFSHLLAGHYNLTMLWPIPIVVLCLYKTIRENWFVNPIMLGVFLTLLGYLDLQLLLFTAIILAIILITNSIFDPKTIFARRRLTHLAVSLLIFITLFLVPYGLIVQGAWGIKTDFLTFNSADFKVLFGLNPLNPIFHYPFLTQVIKMIGSYRENVVPLGFTALFVSLVGCALFIRQFWKEKITFFLCLLVGFLFLVGPYFQKGSIVYYSLKLPYFYLEKLPLFDIGLVPPRFVVIVYFSLALLSGLSMISVMRFLVAKKLHFAAAVLVFISSIFCSLE